MVTAICLLTCALAPVQAGGESEWLLTPRLRRAQELVYRGTVTEESLGQGVRFGRSYRLESRILVLSEGERGQDLALLTELLRRPDSQGHEPAAQVQVDGPGSVRLELGSLGPQGRVGAAHATLLLPLNGPATIECGAFVEVPTTRVRRDQTWSVAEDGRPALAWTVGGLEMIGGVACIKLIGEQQSADWDHPRADHTAWRRREQVWLSTRLGAASRVERTLEERAPAHREPTQLTVTKYELESSLVYPGPLFDDRYREILQARHFSELAAPFLVEPGRYGSQASEALLAKINMFLESQPPTAYRAAILQVKRRAEAARNGQSTPAGPTTSEAPAAVASIGQPAPDFLVPGITTQAPLRLRRLINRPTLLIFYSPTAGSAEEVLNFGQSILQEWGDQVSVTGLTFSEDAEAVRKQHAALKLKFPIGTARSLRQSYAVEATPKLILLDADGIVRAAYVGWGEEMPEALRTELKRWQHAPSGRQDR